MDNRNVANVFGNGTGDESLGPDTPPKIFALTGGRYGRLNYLKAMNIIGLWASLGSVVAFLPMMIGFSILTFLLVAAVFIAAAIFYVRAVVLRLHDMNASGFFAFLLLVPVANFIFMIVTMVVPGTEDGNRFGRQTVSSSPLHIVLFMGLWLLGFIFNMIVTANMNSMSYY